MVFINSDEVKNILKYREVITAAPVQFPLVLGTPGDRQMMRLASGTGAVTREKSLVNPNAGVSS